jgi:hypothetical protein
MSTPALLLWLAVGISCAGSSADRPPGSTGVRTRRRSPAISQTAALPHAADPRHQGRSRSSAFPGIAFLLLAGGATIVIVRLLKKRPPPEVLDVASLLQSEDLY